MKKLVFLGMVDAATSCPKRIVIDGFFLKWNSSSTTIPEANKKKKNYVNKTTTPTIPSACSSSFVSHENSARACTASPLRNELTVQAAS
jgi:hypothetical protein